MKNKKSLYILVPIVLLVWGLIFYKVFSYFGGDEEARGISAPLLQPSDKEDTIKQYSLIGYYKDPFLKYAPQTEAKQEETKMVNKNEQRRMLNRRQQQVQIVQWPQISYHGLVEQSRQENKLGFIKINEKDRLVENGEIVDELEVLALYTDSISLQYKTEKKTYNLYKPQDVQ